MFAKIPRPSRIAAMIVAKLSSARTMSAACLATSVPATPIATPMSADLSAGASLTPSPVMATIAPPACRASTMRSLCSGATRAYTETSRTAALSPSSPSSSISGPVSALAPDPTMPRSPAIRMAVRGWSPVIISTRTPAAPASATAAAASGRGGSMMPTSPR